MTFKEAKPKVYGRQRWKELREEILSKKPACEVCELVLATQVHHKVTWFNKGKIDWDLAYNPTNLQAICVQCHVIQPKANSKRCGKCGARKWDEKGCGLCQERKKHKS